LLKSKKMAVIKAILYGLVLISSIVASTAIAVDFVIKMELPNSQPYYHVLVLVAIFVALMTVLFAAMKILFSEKP
jgi:hypothetical protein